MPQFSVSAMCLPPQGSPGPLSMTLQTVAVSARGILSAPSPNGTFSLPNMQGGVSDVRGRKGRGRAFSLPSSMRGGASVT